MLRKAWLIEPIQWSNHSWRAETRQWDRGCRPASPGIMAHRVVIQHNVASLWLPNISECTQSYIFFHIVHISWRMILLPELYVLHLSINVRTWVQRGTHPSSITASKPTNDFLPLSGLTGLFVHFCPSYRAHHQHDRLTTSSTTTKWETRIEFSKLGA